MFKKLAGVGSTLVLFGTQVHAAVPVAVTDALDDMQADGLVVAGSVLVAIIAIAAIKFIRKGL